MTVRVLPDGQVQAEPNVGCINMRVSVPLPPLESSSEFRMS
jgi:hypothetical protein